MTIDELQVKISANANEFQKEIGKVQAQLNSMHSNTTKATNGMASAFSALKTGIIALGIGAIIKESVMSGVNAIESESLFEVSMGKWSQATRDWSNQMQQALGLNAIALRKVTGTIYNMTTSMGLSEDQSLKMSKGLALLSNDMASFYNISQDEAFQKLSAGLTGETEPLKRLGILVNDNTITQVAYANGIAETGTALTDQQKVAARYIAIMQQTGRAQGDLARTINSPANQMRVLSSNVTNLGVAFSQFLVPVLSAVLPYLNAIAVLATQAFNALANLLGFKAIGGDTSAAIDDTSVSVGGLGSNLDDATGSAKALKNSLSSFDEMNVITQPAATGGSGGSGGVSGGSTFDVGEYNAHLDWIQSKATDVANQIKAVFEDFMSGFNFNKITKAFKQFFADVQTFLKPVGAIVGDVWDRLKPLVYWTANDFLPAFLNAIGGALSFIGTVVSATWEMALKPLIDNFLAPIAAFTGGIAVAALNAIGNGLRFISEQRGVIDVAAGLVNLGTAIAVVIGIWQGYQLVAGIATGVQLAMSGAMVAGTAATGAYAVGLGLVTAAQNAFATATTIANTIFSSSSIVMLGLVAAITAAMTIMEAFKLAKANADLQSQMTITQEELEINARNTAKQAVADQEAAIRSLTDAKAEQTNTALALMNAEDQQTAASNKLNEMIRNGVDPSSREYKRAQLELESASQRVTAAQEALNTASGKVKDAYDKQGNAVWAKMAADKQEELALLTKQGKYDEVTQKLKELSASTLEYKDANGQMAKFSKADTESMALFVGDQLAKAQTGYSKYWDATQETVQKAAKTTAEVKSQFEASGKSFADGLSDGIYANQWKVTQAAKDSATAAKNAFNNTLQIHSPSRVMKRSGGYFTDGIVEGIDSGAASVIKSSQSLSQATASAFDPTSVFSPNLNNNAIADAINGVGNTNQRLSAPSDSLLLGVLNKLNGGGGEPMQLTVKIGEDTILDRMIDGINEKSYMNNRGVIAV